MVEPLAVRAREAARERPFLLEGLAAGVVNYTAAARHLSREAGLDGDEEAIATALRRYADALDRRHREGSARVRMQSGVGIERADTEGESANDPEEPLLAVGDTAVVDGGDHTAVLATGDVDAAALGSVLQRLTATGIDPAAAGVADGSLVVVVGRRDGPDALRVVEAALDAVTRVVDAGA